MHVSFWEPMYNFAHVIKLLNHFTLVIYASRSVLLTFLVSSTLESEYAIIEYFA